jgi:hypothetical protein
VVEIIADERAMIVIPSRQLIGRVLFRIQPITVEGASLHVMYRLAGTNGNWQAATVQEETASSIAITGPQSGESYDFLLQYAHPTLLSSPPTIIGSHYVAGRTSAPAVLRNLSLAIVGGQALLTWALPPETDVQNGGWVMFRHSPDMDATLWPNTTSLAQAVVGEQTHVYMPLKPGTYFARTYDADGRASAPVAICKYRRSMVARWRGPGRGLACLCDIGAGGTARRPSRSTTRRYRGTITPSSCPTTATPTASMSRRRTATTRPVPAASPPAAIRGW